VRRLQPDYAGIVAKIIEKNALTHAADDGRADGLVAGAGGEDGTLRNWRSAKLDLNGIKAVNCQLSNPRNNFAGGENAAHQRRAILDYVSPGQFLPSKRHGAARPVTVRRADYRSPVAGPRLTQRSAQRTSRFWAGRKSYIEVVRDRVDNCIIVCLIENIDLDGGAYGRSQRLPPRPR